MPDLKGMIGEIAADIDAEEAESETLKKLADGVADKPTFAPAKNIRASRADRATPPPERVAEPLIRDGYSMPKSDYDLIEAASERIFRLGLLPMQQAANRSLVIRAALRALSGLDDDGFRMAVEQAPPLQAGRRSINS